MQLDLKTQKNKLFIESIKLEIEKDEVRPRRIPLLVAASEVKVVQQFFSVLYASKVVHELCAFEGLFQQQSIIWIIIGKQNCNRLLKEYHRSFPHRFAYQRA